MMRLFSLSLFLSVLAVMLFLAIPSMSQNLISDPTVAPPPNNPEFMVEEESAAPPPPSPQQPERTTLPGIAGDTNTSINLPSNLVNENDSSTPDLFFDPINLNGIPDDLYDPDRAFRAMSNAKDQGLRAPQQEVQEESVPTTYSKQQVNPNSIPSMLFTVWEYGALKEAQKNIGRALVRPIEDFEVGEEPEVVARPPPEERYISLAGIVYGSRKNWTIWLNGQRVTPKALPEEILDLKVYKEYIEIKWFDDYTRGIFPIRLKPHQRFNLDTRIFLPG